MAASTRQRCKVVLDGKALEVSCFQVWKGLDGVGFKEMFIGEVRIVRKWICVFFSAWLGNSLLNEGQKRNDHYHVSFIIYHVTVLFSNLSI